MGNWGILNLVGVSQVGVSCFGLKETLNELLFHLVLMLELNMLLNELSSSESLFTDSTPIFLALLNLLYILCAELVFQFRELVILMWALKHLCPILDKGFSSFNVGSFKL
jgi:hypothetical protein